MEMGAMAQTQVSDPTLESTEDTGNFKSAVKIFWK